MRDLSQLPKLLVPESDAPRLVRVVARLGSISGIIMLIGAIMQSYAGSYSGISSLIIALSFFIFIACLCILGFRRISLDAHISIGRVILNLALLFIVAPITIAAVVFAIILIFFPSALKL